MRERRPVLRYGDDGVEMVELQWGIMPPLRAAAPYAFRRAESSTGRCLVPASAFRLTHEGQRYEFSLADGDWFYFAGIWRPGTDDWPEGFAIRTIPASGDMAPYCRRQMVVLRGGAEPIAWLDLTRPERDLLKALPCGTFRIQPVSDDGRST